MTTFKDDILHLVGRSRHGFQAFFAMVDLLGVKCLTSRNPREALHRLNDLQGGFFDGLIDFFPRGDEYRICFAGDAVFVIYEFDPDADWRSAWPRFCGHRYAMSCLLNSLDTTIGNPGLRAFIAYGPVLQIREPDIHRRRVNHSNWFVLTGASLALRKCWEAETLGASGGFAGLRIWHERLDRATEFVGTRIVPTEMLGQYAHNENAYPALYQTMLADPQNLAANLPRAAT